MVGIIIINYKDYAEKFLVECRDSLRNQNFQEQFKIYLVDNASSEESRAYLKSNFPEAAVIPRKDGNYCAANNAGIRQAASDGCDLFVIANMDVKFDENWLQELVKAVESDEKIGVAQSKIMLYPKNDEDLKINSLGNTHHFLGFGFTDNYNQPDKEIISLIEIKGYASGCSLIIKKEVIDNIGFYDEEFYMYHDDFELGWRTKLANHKTVLAPKSIIYHKYEFSRSVKMLYYMERNRYLTMLIYYKIPSLILFLPAILTMEIGILFYSIINGWFKTKLKANAYFFKPKTWQQIFKQRKFINKIRHKNDKQIIKNFVGKVEFQEIENPVLKYVANPFFNFYLNLAKRIIFW